MHGYVIFLLAMIPTVVVHHIVVVLKLPTGVDKLISRVYAIIEAMTDNTWFPSPNPLLTAVKAKNDALQAAQNLAKTRAAGTAQSRNVAKNAVLDLLKSLKDYVQSICIANPESAITIAESAMMYAKKISGGKKHVFGVKCLLSGFCELTGALKGRSCTHDWQMSLDITSPNNWYVALIPSTTKSKTVVGNLKPGTTVYFRHRCPDKRRLY